ncbi:hypothetical protein ACGFIU_16405 [Rhodococcus oryzae]|uniref:hypothetical protein n=1 Tax=Rhodococcus oryzae TaxID=2571143 RepID=UPI00371042EC
MTSAKASGFGAAGSKIIDTFTAKATERGMVLDDDDVTVLHLAAATADNIAALDANIAANGLAVSTTYNPKTNPALTEVRQQRLALGRLMTDVVRRLGIAAQGEASGFRRTHDGTGAQNQQRDTARAERRGRGKPAR